MTQTTTLKQLSRNLVNSLINRGKMRDFINNLESGKRLSFLDIFREMGCTIEIPIIQRDYAQGRNSSYDIRSSFLDSLYEYLEGNIPFRDLDFVYGSINECSRFIPIDGQQRLTTLFLLHWYLANASNEIDILRESLAIKEYNDEVTTFRSKFTYETRSSSKEFCDALISNQIDLSNLLEATDGLNDNLSKTIQNCGWFYLSWNCDPTIQSMLVMLDSIHDKFKGRKDFFSRLIDKTKPIITFLFLNLKEFKLTDDLYIKMNARGMPLNNFENFKAKFEQYIGQLEWCDQDKRLIEYTGNETIEKEVYPKEYFSHKIDTDWTNLFWTYRNTNGKDNSIDDELMNFFRVIFANEYAGSQTPNDENLEIIMGTQVAQKSKNYTYNLTFYAYKKFGILTKKSVLYLINALNCLENKNNKIKQHLNNTFYFNENDVFEKVLKHDLTFPQRVQFHAYIKYLIEHKENLNGINQWMRIIHNLTENTRIDGASEVAVAITVINKLIPYGQDILSYLKKQQVSIDFFYSKQILEEIIKAFLITRSEEWQHEIISLENHKYFKGQIGFALKFSGIMDYYIRNNNCNWNNDENVEYFNSFLDYSKKIHAIFCDDGLKKFPDFIWERSLLVKGNYLIKYGMNYSFLKDKHRDISWKRLLRDVDSNELNCIKLIFDDYNFNINDINGSLKSIIKNSDINDWRKPLIKHKEIMEYCVGRQARFKYNFNYAMILSSERMNGKHIEMYSYALYLKYIFPNEFAPFNKKFYYEICGDETIPYISICDWKYKLQNYRINIFIISNYKSVEYCIQFVNNDSNEISTDVKVLLINNGFKLNQTNKMLELTLGKEKEVIMQIKSLCNQFNQIL